MNSVRPSILRPGPERRRLIYWTVWVLLALPLPITLYFGLRGHMRQEEDMVRDLGLWGLRILIASLAVTPAARLLRRPALMRYRRTLGMFGFVYAAVHGLYFTVYGRLWEMPLFRWERRPYFAIGIAALILMTPLAVTSTDGMIRWLGAAGWRRLHQSVYVAMILVCIHSLWQMSIDYTQPAIYLILTVGLLAVRLPPVMRALTRRRGRAPSSPVVQSTP